MRFNMSDTESIDEMRELVEFLEDLKLDKFEISNFIPVDVEKGGMAKKLELAAPYNMFLTAITDSKPTHREPLTIHFQEILDESLGKIEASVQINFDIDVSWLLAQYHYANIDDKPLLILYGFDHFDLNVIGEVKPHVTAIKTQLESQFAASNSKIMLFGYEDGGMRVVILTANLKRSDWHNRTQSLWMSPLLPALPKGADPTTAGESPTGFKKDLIDYLLVYKVTQLDEWIERIRKSDFSAIKVFFIPSVPGKHGRASWGCERLGSVLSKHVAPINDTVPVVSQSSSIGSLGHSARGWVQRDLIRNLRKSTGPVEYHRPAFVPFKMIHPSHRNVLGSHDGLLGSCSVYRKEVNDKQPWLKDCLQQWKSDVRHRSQAMPHNKCFARFNEQEECLYWFLLTSANTSKAAWGIANRFYEFHISNYEAGVLFLPRFVTGEETFPLGKSRNGIPAFPMPYDVPLTPYETEDVPILGDFS